MITLKIMIKKSDVHLHKITVNSNSSGIWVIPSSFKLFTPHKRDFVIKKAKSIAEIIQENKLFLGNYYFSFNKDHEFALFNELQKQSDLGIYVDNKIIKNIEENQKQEFIINEKISIVLDEKGIYNIFRGNSFFVNKEYFDNLFDYLNQRKQIKNNQAKFVWRKKEFVLLEK